MRSFLKLLALFLLPLVMVFVFPTVVLLRAGEFYPAEAVGKLARRAEPIVIGQAYSNLMQDYQLQETLARRPEVIALGTSRVSGFRSTFFKDPSIFYNNTGVTDALSLFRYFMEAVADHPPKVVIAGMDQFFFNPENAKNNIVTRPNSLLIRTTFYDAFLESLFRQKGWMKVYQDYVAGKLTLVEVFSERPASTTLIGLRALTGKGGTRNDGSYYAAEIIQSSQAQQQALTTIDTLAASISASNGDEYGNTISPEALAEVRTFLKIAKQQGVQVVGYLPPISHKVYRRLHEYPEASYAEVLRTLVPTLAAIYKEYGYEFYDFSDIVSFGGSDAEMVESKHGSEKLYLRMFIKVASEGLVLRPYVDTSYLKAKLQQSPNTYQVFPL